MQPPSLTVPALCVFFTLPSRLPFCFFLNCLPCCQTKENVGCFTQVQGKLTGYSDGRLREQFECRMTQALYLSLVIFCNPWFQHW